MYHPPKPQRHRVRGRARHGGHGQRATVVADGHEQVPPAARGTQFFVHESRSRDDDATQCFVHPNDVYTKITFRRDPSNFRPRINKMESVKDREQKATGYALFVLLFWGSWVVATVVVGLWGLTVSILASYQQRRRDSNYFFMESDD